MFKSKKKHDKNVTIILLTAVLILMLILLTLTVYLNQNSLKEVLTNSELEIGSAPIDLNIDEEEEVADYRLLKYKTREDMYLLDAYNEEIAIESLQEACGAKVFTYIDDNINQRFILQDWNAGSERPPQNFYKVDTEKLTCSKMKISSEVGDFGGYRISPDNSKLAVSLESNPNIITVLDFETDTARVVARAGENETFNAGWGALSNNFIFLWDDNKTLQYDTFQDVPRTQFYLDNGKPLISTELVEVE